MSFSTAALLTGLTSASVLTACNLGEPGVQAEGVAAGARPNFLVLFTDDQRFDAIGALRSDQLRTPNMDRLVRDGVTFSNTYIMGSVHGAVCMPSRAMLLTGRNLFSLPTSVTVTWSVPAEQQGDCPYVTMPEHFRNAGYETFVTGKWHNGRKLLARGFTAGAEIFFGGMSDHLAVPVYDFDPEGEYGGEPRKAEKFSSELFADAAIEFLSSRQSGQPFLAYVSFTAPHDPRMAPREYAEMYDPAGIELPPNFLPEHPFPIPDLRVRDEMLTPHPRTPDVVREHIAAYFAMITHLDAQIGRILDALDRSGLSDDTYIILAGDNGLAVGQHGLLGKQSIYEHSSRVPLIIAGPGLPRGERREALCYLHDVFPTMCDLAGLEKPDSIQTRSLAGAARSATVEVRDAVFLAYSKGHKSPKRYQRGVRHGDWKLIETHFDGEITHQLFNLRQDPWEMRNLAVDSAHAERLLAMCGLLGDLSHRYEDPLRPAAR